MVGAFAIGRHTRLGGNFHLPPFVCGGWSKGGRPVGIYNAPHGFVAGFRRNRQVAELDTAQDESYISRVDQSISDYVVTRLNSSPTPSATTLELELNRATASAFDGLSFEAMKQGNPAWHGFAFVLQNSPAPPGEYVVIVTIGPGNTPWNVIRGFARRGGSYVSVARAGDDLKNRRLAVDRMESFGPEEVRFLVSGWLAQTPGLWGSAISRRDGFWPWAHLSGPLPGSMHPTGNKNSNSTTAGRTTPEANRRIEGPLGARQSRNRHPEARRISLRDQQAPRHGFLR